MIAQLPSQDELEKLLTANGIDTTQWGSGNTKTVADLNEIAQGETLLELDPLRRIVRVAGVIIRKGSNIASMQG